MGFFSKKRPEVAPKVEPVLDLSATTQDRVEIQVAKDASAKAKKKVDNINTQFNELLEENHFHVKIYIAAGRKPKGGENA